MMVVSGTLASAPIHQRPFLRLEYGRRTSDPQDLRSLAWEMSREKLLRFSQELRGRGKGTNVWIFIPHLVRPCLVSHKQLVLTVSHAQRVKDGTYHFGVGEGRSSRCRDWVCHFCRRLFLSLKVGIGCCSRYQSEYFTPMGSNDDREDER
jgi:hypothetical protein